MGRLPIKIVVVLAVLAIAIPAMLFSRFLILNALRPVVIGEADKKNLLILDTVRAELEDALYVPLWHLKVLGGLVERERDRNVLERGALAIKESFPHFIGLCLLDERGIVRMSVPPSHLPLGKDISKDPLFKEAKTLLAPIYGLHEVDGERHIHVIVPFRGFFLLGCVDILWLKDMLRKLGARRIAYLLTDGNGSIVVEGGGWGQDPKAMVCVSEGLKGKKGPFLDRLGGEAYVTYASIIKLVGWLLCIGEEREAAFSAYTKTKNILLLSLLLSSLVAVLLGLLVIGKVSRGIRGLAEQASLIAEGRYDLRPVATLTKEVDSIGRMLLRMAEAIREREGLLRQERDRFRAVIEHLPLPVIVLDHKGKFLHINSAFKQTLGYSENDIPNGRTWFRLAYPDEASRRKVVESWKRIADEHGPSGPFIFTVRAKDGRQRTLEFHSVRTQDMFVVVAEDVTEEREMGERFRNLFNESRDAIFFVDKDGRFIDVNQAALELYGYESKEEFLRLHITDLIAKEEDRRRIVRELRKQGFVRSFETIHRRKDGQEIYVRDTATAIFDEKRQIKEYIGIVRDVTQLKRLEQQFMQAQKMEVVGRLTGGIAHDFNNMLTVVMGGLQMVQTMLPSDHPAHKYIKIASDASEKTASFVKQLLAFSRRQILELKPVNVNDLVAEVARVTRKTLREDIELDIVLTKARPIVRADTAQMNQVLLNLMVNAQDAMEKGGRITIETYVAGIDEEYVRTHPEAKKGQFAVIALSDTGKGIPKEIVDKIFEPFFTTKKDGTGLGLSVCYGIVKWHGGFMNVYSEVDRGTTFKVYLPLAEGEVEERKQEKEAAKGGSETILLVEDDERVRRITEGMLHKLGYRVLVARDGEEAIEVFKEKAGEIDLCLMDLVMPKKGGMETFDELRRMREDVRVVFMTGYAENSIHADFILKEGLGLLSKPFTVEVLAKKLREILEGKP